MPLKMFNSGIAYQYEIIKDLADSYFFVDEENKKLVNDFPVYIQNWYAAGAMYSTTEDLLEFTKALFGLKLLTKKSLDMMLMPGLDDYGYSVWLAEWKLKGKKYLTVQRPGRIMGAQTKLLHFPAENITIIILSNTGTTDIDRFSHEIGKRVL